MMAIMIMRTMRTMRTMSTMRRTMMVKLGLEFVARGSGQNLAAFWGHESVLHWTYFFSQCSESSYMHLTMCIQGIIVYPILCNRYCISGIVRRPNGHWSACVSGIVPAVNSPWLVGHKIASPPCNQVPCLHNNKNATRTAIQGNGIWH